MLAKRPLITYTLLAWRLSWAAMLPLVLARRGVSAIDVPHQDETIAVFGPFITAYIVLRATASPPARAEFWASLQGCVSAADAFLI